MSRQEKVLGSRVLKTIRERRLLAGVSRLLLAVSGGPDSVCLAHILFDHREELELDLHIAHLDHQLRGANSAADAEYVRLLARQLGLPVTVEARDVRAYRAKKHISLEEAAREVRYAFLAEVARANAAQAAAVGHTRDDNVETTLMHIIRGAGANGMRGLQPVNELRTASGMLTVLRPLLEASRGDTAEYCREHGLDPRMDETNRSFAHFRNRIRLELLPLLRSYNPKIEETLSRNAGIAADELSLVNGEAAKAWDRVVSRHRQTVALDKNRFLMLHRALKRQILRLAVRQVVGDLRDIESRHIEDMLGATEKPSGRAFQLPRSLVFVVEHDRYIIGRDSISLCPYPAIADDFALNVPGETVASSWRISAALLSRKGIKTLVLAEKDPRSEGRDPREKGSADAPRNPRPPIFDASPWNEGAVGMGAFGATSEVRAQYPAPAEAFSSYFDYERIGSKLEVRTLRPGDRFMPLGLGASKKVGEFMIDAKIPRSWRKRIPIVVTPVHVAWVVGSRIDERVKVTPETRTVLRLDFSFC